MNTKEFDNELELGFEFITPAQADHLLKTNSIKNRPVNPKIVESYARQMLKGLWNPDTLEAIGIDKDGHLINGQHRLSGVIKAFETNPKFKGMTFFVGRNMRPEIMDTLDSGYSRTLLNAMHIHGKDLKNQAAVGGAIRVLFNLSICVEKDCSYEAVRNVFKPSNGELISFAEKLPNFFESCNHFYKTFKYTTVMKTMPLGISLAMYYLYSRAEHDHTFAFFKTLETGIPFDGLKEKSPVYHYYQRARRNKEMRVYIKPSETIQMFLWTFTRQLEGKVGFLKMPNSFDWELNPKNPVHDVIFKAMLRLP